jgi:hypothetical protein
VWSSTPGTPSVVVEGPEVVRVSVVGEVLALALLGAHDGGACAGPDVESLPASVRDPALVEARRGR